MRFIQHLKQFFHTQSEQSVLYLPVLLGLGVLWYFMLPTEPAPMLGLKATLAAAGLALVFRNLWESVALTAISVVALGFMAAQFRTQEVAQPLLERPVYAVAVSGHVEEVMLEESGYKLLLNSVAIESLAAQKTPHRIRLSVRGANPAIPPIGARVAMKATLFPLPSPTMPQAYDFGRHFFFEGIGAVGLTLTTPEVIAQEAQAPTEQLHAFRNQFATQLMEVMPPETSGIAAALTVGEQKAVSKADAEAMRGSGLYHIISISGLHLSIATGLVFFALRLLLAQSAYATLHFPIKKMAAAGALVAGFFYLLAAGWPVPAQRSFIMVAVVLVAIMLDRKALSLTTLAWAAVAVLLIRPEALMGASFQLSFAATAAIIALYERYGSALAGRGSILGKAAKWILATMAVSLAASLATTPLVVHNFNQFQWLGVLANVAVAPITSFLIMPGVVLSFLLAPLGLLAPATWLLNQGIEWMLAIAHAISAVPHATLQVPSYTTLGFSLSITGFIWLLLVHGRLGLLGLGAMALAALSLFISPMPDALISEDAKQIAVRDATGHWVMVRGEADSFVVESWMQRVAQKAPVAMVDARWNESTSLNCSDTGCEYTCNGSRILFMKQPRATKERCTKDITVAVMGYGVRSGECEGVAHVIDKRALRKGGAHAIACEATRVQVETVENTRGSRPWVNK